MTWFVMIPPSYAGKPDAEKELVDFRIEYTDPRTIAAVEAGKIVSAARGYQDTGYGGQDLVKWKGPFATEAQAKAAQNPQQQSPNPASDAVNAAQNATGGFGGFLAGVSDFFSLLTSAHTWLRVAEFLVGGAFLIIGLNHLLGNPAGKVASVAAKVRP